MIENDLDISNHADSASTARLEVAIYASHQVALERVRSCLNPAEFLVHLCPLPAPGAPAPTVVPSQAQIVDVHGSLAIVESIASELRQQGTHPVLLALDESFSLDSAFPLIFLGVRGLIAYDRIQHELARAIRQVVQGVFWIPRSMLSGMVELLLARVPAGQKPFPLVQLSRREREMVPLLLDSRTNKEIAVQLNISERTVKYHVANLLRKCRVRRRHELAIFLYRNGMLPSASAALPPL